MRSVVKRDVWRQALLPRTINFSITFDGIKVADDFGLPADNSNETMLEYFSRAIRWLADVDGWTAPEDIHVVHVSKVVRQPLEDVLLVTGYVQLKEHAPLPPAVSVRPAASLKRKKADWNF